MLAKIRNELNALSVTLKVILAMVALSCCFLCVPLTINPSETTSDLFLSLSASFIAVIPTSLFINWIFSRDKEKRWSHAKEIAKEDTRLFCNKLVSYMASPLGYRITIGVDENYQEELEAILLSVLEHSMENRLVELETSSWKALISGLKFTKPDFLEYIQLYGEIWPPELLACVLRIHKEFRELYFIMTLIPDLLTLDEKDWPTFKEWGDADATRESLIMSIAESFEAYFYEVNEFYYALEKWQPEV